MSGISWRQAALLAVLLDADGGIVAYPLLGDAVGAGGVNESALIRGYVHRLRARGVDCIGVVEGHGCRLVGLPPDWALEDVLAMLDVLRREDYELPAMVWRKAS